MMAAPAPGFATAAAFVAAGLAFGRIYFAVLRRSVELYAAGNGRLVPLALTVARIAGAIVFLGFAVHFGALPLLATFGGFLIARAWSLRAARRTA